jgi:two-component system, NarL family, sensor histidine kinase UhpB
VTIHDSESSHALFRCIQEGLTNSVKHASAQNVRVVIAKTPEGLDVSIRDDGTGVREVTPGRGLEGMTARALQIGGRVEFRSKPGHGFEVHLSVPTEAGRGMVDPSRSPS